MFDFSIVTSWVHELLTSFMPLGLAIFIECVIVGLCILLMYVVVAILMIFMERKVCAAFQCRLGPMRVGPWGTLQVFADVFKMLTKEIITIRRSDKFLYNLAPYIVILASVLAFSCLPFNKGMEILDFNVGVFFMMAASSSSTEIYRNVSSSSDVSTFGTCSCRSARQISSMLVVAASRNDAMRQKMPFIISVSMEITPPLTPTAPMYSTIRLSKLSLIHI